MCTICALTIEFAVDHPQTLAVAVATREAMDTGLLPERPADNMDMTQSRHQAVVLLTTIQQRLEQVLPASRLLALPDFFILMIESRTWGYFHPTLAGFDMKASPQSPRLDGDAEPRDAVIVVSQAAGERLVDGQVPFQSALQSGLVIVDAPSSAALALRSALTVAYPLSKFSTFVCTEVA